MSVTDLTNDVVKWATQELKADLAAYETAKECDRLSRNAYTQHIKTYWKGRIQRAHDQHYYLEKMNKYTPSFEMKAAIILKEGVWKKQEKYEKYCYDWAIGEQKKWKDRIAAEVLAREQEYESEMKKWEEKQNLKRAAATDPLHGYQKQYPYPVQPPSYPSSPQHPILYNPAFPHPSSHAPFNYPGQAGFGYPAPAPAPGSGFSAYSPASINPQTYYASNTGQRPNLMSPRAQGPSKFSARFFPGDTTSTGAPLGHQHRVPSRPVSESSEYSDSESETNPPSRGRVDNRQRPMRPPSAPSPPPFQRGRR